MRLADAGGWRRTVLLALPLTAVLLAGVGVLHWAFLRPLPSAEPAAISGTTETPGTPEGPTGPDSEALQGNDGLNAELLNALDVPAMPVEELDARLRREAWQREQEEERRKVAMESLETTVQHVIDTPTLVPLHQSIHSPYATLRNLERDAGMAKLFRICREGTAEEQEQLRSLLADWAHSYLYELPPFTPNGAPWQPTVAFVGAASAFPVLMADLTPDSQSLGAFVSIFVRQQDAEHAREAAAGRPVDSQKVIYSVPFWLLGEACRRVLDRLDEGAMTAAQKEVLAEYHAWQRARRPDDVSMGTDLGECLVFAARLLDRDVRLLTDPLAGTAR